MKHKTRHKSFRLREDLLRLSKKQNIDLTNAIHAYLELALKGEIKCLLCNGRGTLAQTHLRQKMNKK